MHIARSTAPAILLRSWVWFSRMPMRMDNAGGHPEHEARQSDREAPRRPACRGNVATIATRRAAACCSTAGLVAAWPALWQLSLTADGICEAEHATWQEGIEFVPNCEVGKDIEMQSLFEQVRSGPVRSCLVGLRERPFVRDVRRSCRLRGCMVVCCMVVWSMLHVVWSMLHVAWLYAAWCMLHACMLHGCMVYVACCLVEWSMLHVAWLYAAWCMLHGSMLHGCMVWVACCMVVRCLVVCCMLHGCMLHAACCM